MFRLVRFFLLTSAAAAAAIVIGIVFYRQNEVERLLDIAERQNVEMARLFANTIWPRFASHVQSASEFSENELRNHPESRSIGQAVEAVSAGLSVLKIKIYNLDGLTVYSSDPSEIGENKTNNPGYISAAREGRPASKLTFRNTFSSFEETVQERDLVESYLPIRQGGGSGGHKGVGSIISSLENHDFVRIRVGIGRPTAPPDLAPTSEDDIIAFVLSDFTTEEKQAIAQVIPRVSEAIRCLLSEGLEVAMNKYN